MAQLGLKSVFKRVRFPKYAPIPYQKMVDMSLNDQYLKDTMDALPTGIVKRVDYGTGDGIDTSTENQNAALRSITFTLNEPNRLIKISYHTMSFVRSADTNKDIFSYKNELFYVLDGEEGDPIYPTMTKYGPLPVIVPRPVGSGEHTLEMKSVYWSGSPPFYVLGSPFTPKIYTTPVSASSREDFFLIEDLGSYISPGSSVESRTQ